MNELRPAQISNALSIFFDPYYLDWIPNENPKDFNEIWSADEFRRTKWGFPYVCLAISSYILRERKSDRRTLIDALLGHSAFSSDKELIAVGDFIVLETELSALKPAHWKLSALFKSFKQQKIEMRELRTSVLVARMRNLNDLYEQARGWSSTNIDGVLAGLRGWEGLDGLATAYAICFAGTEVIADVQAGNPSVLRGIDLLQKVMEAVCDDLNEVLKP